MENEQLQKATKVLKKLHSKLQEYEKKELEQAAIIGMACRFPGKSNDLSSYWNMLSKGESCVGTIPDDRWDVKKYYDKNPLAPGKYSTLLGSFIDDAFGFDGDFFNINKEEAAATDPHHRLLLTVTWEALQNAYIPLSEISGKNVGVFVGVASDKYDYIIKYSQDPERINGYTGTGNTLSGAAGRISYALNSQGPSVVIDTGSSSSLVAFHHAVKSLMNHECDIAIVGGVSLLLSPLVYIILTKMGILSSDGHTRSLDKESSGFGRGEGCGAIILKRLSDAQQNRDKVLATVRGTAINHNGKTLSLTASSQEAQENLFKQTLANAHIPASSVTYIEANATASNIGDAQELDAINTVYGQARTSECYLGAANSLIGHLDAATGIAGVIKVVLQLIHKKLTPHLHFRSWNEYVHFSKNEFQVPTKITTWQTEGDAPRIAAVSSYGWAGQNAHAILQEHPRELMTQEIENGPYLLPISAKSEIALFELLCRYEQYLPEHHLELSEIAKLASVGRDHYTFRVAFLADDVEGILKQIQNMKNNLHKPSGRQVVFQFPDIDYSAAFFETLAHQEIAVKIKETTGIDITLESNEQNVQILRNFASRYLLAQFWTSLIGKPNQIVSSQSSAAGEMAFFGDKSLDEAIATLTVAGTNKTIDSLESKNCKSSDILIIMTIDTKQPIKIKSILRDVYNSGKNINWLYLYKTKMYEEFLELPKHPLYPQRYM